MSNSAAVEEVPPHKKRKMSPPPWGSLLSSLPDEIVLRCLARVSRSDHLALSMVSKSYRSVMSCSSELYKMRSQMGVTEKCHYVCLRMSPDPIPQWCILRRGKLLRIPIPKLPSLPWEASSVVVVDWGIYIIGGRIVGKRICKVKLLDCRTNTWCSVPSMKEPRASAAAGVVGGKIYVFGGCRKDSSNFAEVFDIKAQTWDTLPTMPDRRTRSQYIHDSVVVREEKIYAVDTLDNSFYYSVSESKWGRGSPHPPQGNRRDWCVIDELIFCIDSYGNLCWCDTKQLECFIPEWTCWSEVKGLGSLNEALSRSRVVHFDSRLQALWDKFNFDIAIGREAKLSDLLPGVRLSNSGSNIVLFWDVVQGDHLQLWSAEISFEKRQGHEIWGNIEWSNAFMTVDHFFLHYKVLHSVPVTL